MNAGPTGDADAALLALIQAREEDALDALYRRHAAAVFSLALRICRQSALAEEATQDTFLQIWREADRYVADRASVRSWILMMARARALDRLRAQRVRSDDAIGSALAVDALVDRREGPEQGAAVRESVDEVGSVLDFLPVDERRLVDLAYLQGLTHTEMATALQRPVGTIKTQMRRVLRLLRFALVETRRPFAWCPWAESPRGRQSSGPSLSELQVLVVDDDADTLRLITFVLRRAGAGVMAAGSAEQAMRILAGMWPDVLVSDLDMPAEDGFSLLERVRALSVQLRRDLPTIAFSAHAGIHDRLRTTAAGARRHLAKPIRPSQLIDQIAALARRHEPPPVTIPARPVPGFAATS